jgi:hypothetical protein
MELRAALREHAENSTVRRVVDTGFGQRYDVVGELRTPSGRRPRMCTVWQVDVGRLAPRLITTYPLAHEDPRT